MVAISITRTYDDITRNIHCPVAVTLENGEEERV